MTLRACKIRTRDIEMTNIWKPSANKYKTLRKCQVPNMHLINISSYVNYLFVLSSRRGKWQGLKLPKKNLHPVLSLIFSTTIYS